MMEKSSVKLVTYRKPEKRDAIIRGAYVAIAQKGYSKVSLRDIASQAGVPKSILHYYFDNKDQLILEVLYYLHNRMIEIVHAVINKPSTVEEKLEEVFLEFNKFTMKEPKWFIVMIDIMIQLMQTTEGKRILYSLYQRMKEPIVEGLQNAETTGEIQGNFDKDGLVFLIVAMVNGLAMLFITSSENPTDISTAYSYFREMLQNFLKKMEVLNYEGTRL